MTIIALVGNKGGAGKTTLTVNLASAMSQTVSTVVVDADPQRSSLQWKAMRDAPQGLDVLDGVDDLGQAVDTAREGHTHVMIDCPPSVHAPQTHEALRLCDLALVPVQPSPLDLWATVHIEQAVETAREDNPTLRALLIINQLEPRTRLSKLVRQGLAELSMPAADAAIHRRVAYRASVLEGKSVFELGSQGRTAADEILQLISEVNLQ